MNKDQLKEKVEQVLEIMDGESYNEIKDVLFQVLQEAGIKSRLQLSVSDPN